MYLPYVLSYIPVAFILPLSPSSHIYSAHVSIVLHITTITCFLHRVGKHWCRWIFLSVMIENTISLHWNPASDTPWRLLLFQTLIFGRWIPEFNILTISLLCWCHTHLLWTTPLTMLEYTQYDYATIIFSCHIYCPKYLCFLQFPSWVFAYTI